MMIRRTIWRLATFAATFALGLAVGGVGVLAYGDRIGTPLVVAGMRLANAGMPPVWTASFGTAQQLTETTVSAPPSKPLKVAKR